ncbi:unnamed protein product [Clonostachys rosea f. rosea IK726]|uniref:VTC domain-containing protein n=2 Tax=Bionectria ochroleuca TaxID=29856 RepID=A0A0B7JLR6_BIOOC|nr:unnamed protein product [Clonostachys rosea f. rosea IK726]
MEQPQKRSFLRGLLRRASHVRAAAKKTEARRVSLGDLGIRRERRRSVSGSDTHIPKQRLRVRSDPVPEPSLDQDWETEPEFSKANNSKGKLSLDSSSSSSSSSSHRTPSPEPLTQWPPSGIRPNQELTSQEATQLICRGVPLYQGCKRQVPHASEDYFALYATTAENRAKGTDAIDLHDAMVHLMTIKLQSTDAAANPWESLEQPSYGFHYGEHEGSITLNRWVSTASVYPPSIRLKDAGVMPRPMSLERILDRVQELQAGLEEDDPALMYKILYRRLLRDPDRILAPHKTLDKQITDLIMALSRPSWFDFSNPKNQVVTRFIFDNGQDNFEIQFQKFFHQLLLALELEMRIQSPQHGAWAKEKLLETIPQSIKWTLALARRWRLYVRVEDFGRLPHQIKLRYKLKKRQVRLLRRFAQTMKWPNLADTMEQLKQKDSDFALDKISSDAFAFFSGLVLPGITFPFLIMNTLLDLDPDPATDELALLRHMHPECGFQYRSSYTYWTACSIVGKVLAPTCNSLAGWVGPARTTTDLNPSQIARIRTRQPKQKLRLEDVDSMAERSEPLGPPADSYPAADYVLDIPNTDAVVDTVRVEMLGLRAAVTTVKTTEKHPETRKFDATVQFAIDGLSWPLRLMYDVNFISSFPCSDGPHALFFDYVYQRKRVDEIVSIKDWGGLYGTNNEQGVNGTSGDANDEERVLVAECFGVRDNEVLARAWCAHWGLSAIVADLRRTCLACAVREAYAATLNVVILIQGQEAEDDL